MKNILLVVFALFTFQVTFAQQFKTENSNSFNKEREDLRYDVVLPSAYGFTLMSYSRNYMLNKRSVTLEKHDQTMQPIETVVVDLPELGNRFSDLEEVVEYDDKLILLSSVMHKKSKKHQFSAQIFSAKEYSVQDTKILADFPIEKYSRSGEFQVAVSPDKSKIAIIGNLPYVKKTKEKVIVKVYDAGLNLLWEQNETLDYKSEKSYTETSFVDNTGMVYISKTSNKYKKTRKTEIITFNGTSTMSNPFSEKGFMAMDMQLIEVDGKTMLTGFYWDAVNSVLKINSKEGDDTNGVFLYDLADHSLIGKHKWIEGLKNADDYKSMELLDVLLADNNIFLIGEKRLTDSEFRKQNGKPTNTLDYIYTHGSSVIANLDFKGNLRSFEPIANSVVYKNDQREKASIASLNVGNGIQLMFNNNGRFYVHSVFNGTDIGFSYPSVRTTGNSMPTTPSLLPETVAAVEGYNMAYFITTRGDQYWCHKLTWE